MSSFKCLRRHYTIWNSLSNVLWHPGVYERVVSLLPTARRSLFPPSCTNPCSHAIVWEDLVRLGGGHNKPFLSQVAVADDLDVGLGGTCVNVGCVPKKLFAYGSEITTEVADAKGFGWDYDKPGLDWKRLIDNKNSEISRLNGIYERMLNNAGVDVVKGRATVKDAHTVAVGDKTYSADKILVAVGGWPVMPDIEGKEHMITSNEIFYLKDAPKKAVIIGSGYIAVEFAGILH
eukprot:222008-Amorphochlora_amoeboformis.AAC.3